MNATVDTLALSHPHPHDKREINNHFLPTVWSPPQIWCVVVMAAIFGLCDSDRYTPKQHPAGTCEDFAQLCGYDDELLETEC